MTRNNLKTKSKPIKYSLTFVSLIAPGTISTIRLMLKSKTMPNDKRKLLVKQSYMLLTWLYYLKNNSTKPETKPIPAFFIHPVKQTKSTLIKAPMAHKTFSQEQYLFKCYKLTISFSNRCNLTLSKQNNGTVINSSNDALLFAFFLRKSLLNFETNFFFLQKIRFNFYYKDSNIFLLF
jgi:hypothetical protein